MEIVNACIYIYSIQQYELQTVLCIVKMVWFNGLFGEKIKQKIQINVRFDPAFPK